MNSLITQQPMDIKRRYTVLLLSFFLLAYILPLSARDLLVPDETRYGEIPREMIAGGDWVVPHLNGLRYFEKPPLGYWVNAGSLLLFGENNFAVRFPSAMSVGLSALLIYALVNQVRRDKSSKDNFPAILAILSFISSFEVFVVGNIAVLDSLFSLFLTATLSTFYFASEASPGSGKEKRFLLLAGLSCGLAFLTKGFLAFAVPVLVVVPYMVWSRRFFDLIRMNWLPVLVAALVVLPWGILIHLREPDFFSFFFWNEHIHRFIADSAQHKESFWFFFMASPGLFMPWTFIIPATAAGIKEQIDDLGPQGRLIRFSICWLVMPFLFFSASKGKLLTYILPCFPPLTILIAFGLLQRLAQGKNRSFQWGVGLIAIFFGLILLALLYVQFFSNTGFRLYSQSWKVILLANGLVFMSLFCLWSLHSPYEKDKMFLIGFAPLLLFFLAHFIIPDFVIEENAPGRLLKEHRNQIKPDSVIITCEEAASAACWVLKRNDLYLLEPGGELTYGLKYKDAAGRLLDVPSATHLINQNRGKTILICRAKRIRDLGNVLPKPVYQEDNGADGYIFWKY